MKKITGIKPSQFTTTKNDNSGFRPNQAVRLKEGSKEFEELKRNTEKRQEARKPKSIKRPKPLLVGDVVRFKISK
jgi:hypothetical protein